MRILGLDPGARYTGFGLIDQQGSQLRSIAHGRIALPRDAPLPARLAYLVSEARALVDRLAPDAAVLEALYRGVNPRSLIVLAQARGALVATMATAGIAIHEYSPAEVKMAVTGNGRADKQQVGRMVRLILGLRESRLPPDASDALAVAICFAHRRRLDRLGGPREILPEEVPSMS